MNTLIAVVLFRKLVNGVILNRTVTDDLYRWRTHIEKA